MIPVFWNVKNELTRVPKGQKIKLVCGKCNQKAMFHECSVDNEVQLYFLVKLFKQTKRVMQCGECLAVCNYYDIFPENPEATEKAEAERKQHEAEAELKKQQEAELQRKRQLEAEAKKREEERLRKESQVDDELAELKRKLGK